MHNPQSRHGCSTARCFTRTPPAIVLARPVPVRYRAVSPGSREAVSSWALVLYALCASACGDPTATHSTQETDHSTAFLSERAGTRQVVAEVNGVPIYGDCVARQAAFHHLDRRAALAQCIDFELLAQEAQARGLGRHPEVVQAGKNELVRRFIDEYFTARFPDPDGTDRALLEELYNKHRQRRYYRPIYRHTRYARAGAENAAEGSAEDGAARALADEIYTALADKRGLTEEEFQRIAREVAGDRTIQIGEPFAFPRVHQPPYHRGAVEPFAAAAFAIPEVGMVSPPTRTRWGWDVILLTAIDPAIDKRLDDAKEELFLIVRRREYLAWSSALGKGKRVEVHADVLERHQADEDARRFAPSEGP
ncbi:MAG: peptidyl-prolyl cis-trans isomerase [Proteobacteria bacterium]|nr:peptidyl-prolyl cis-trans isomerase [Pseudomonadota bacterium]